ncbi:response regulator [Tunturiibacter empetritectus]|uniref:LytR/AlgR family response regulator transcription factor n=1 Tax=Tunturiibacter empetritectus TaxID=3069691 RepID=UPI003D9BCD14
MMIHAILADDEVLARQKLRQLLRDEPEIEIVGEGASASETIDLVRATGPELLFLDIRMPGMDGFDIIGKLSVGSDSVVPRIIFTTAYDCYALRAFEIHAVDYLLKPFTSERLHSAVQRAREQIYATKQDAGRSNGRSSQNASLYNTYCLQVSWAHPLSPRLRHPMDWSGRKLCAHLHGNGKAPAAGDNESSGRKA